MFDIKFLGNGSSTMAETKRDVINSSVKSFTIPPLRIAAGLCGVRRIPDIPGTARLTMPSRWGWRRRPRLPVHLPGAALHLTNSLLR